jgi:broad specificity phosphatase PhoE
MGTITFVRHGQASFGASDYDQLSELGERQCAALGEYFAARGRRFDAVITGTLKRHAQSLAALSSRLPGLPDARALPALNEYDAEGLVRAVAATGPLPKHLPEHQPGADRREHFRLLRDALALWMRGELAVPGMPAWAEFRGGIAAALDELRRSGADQVLVVSSGGPIATAIAHVLDAPPSAVVALNLQMRNSALTEITFTPARHWLVSFNGLPHLDHPERAGWISHS